MTKKNRLRLALAAVIAVGLAFHGGCSNNEESSTRRNEVAQYSGEVASAWFKLFNTIVKSEKISPPVASRAYGYCGVALYESVVPGMEATHRSLMGQLNSLGGLPAPSNAAYHWPSVANTALATIARDLFAEASVENRATIDALEQSFIDQFKPQAGQTVFDRSAAYGAAVGTAVYAWAFSDGYVTLNNCPFTPPTGPGRWAPTPPAFGPPLQPCWGELRPFVLSNSGECAPPPPPPYDENHQSPFFQQAVEVYTTVKSLTADQNAIALFWADNPGVTPTPPGHWVAILSQLVDSNQYKLDVAAEAYARLGIAEADAFISCWRAKYIYNLVRPITCVRLLIDPNFSPVIATPPFPEYTSGHSVQSAASAQVLTDMLGHFPFVDHTHDADGLNSRSFSDFFDAAQEAQISRLYAGIHYRAAIADGNVQGICIGMKVSALQFHR
ncbi:MAG: vanadium-dependent haloperoxidase [candidate division Zixibacteria bacterium]|nr:vanadium-dependent haloperoxidase [candidate division Zixibacteria bacterium]